MRTRIISYCLILFLSACSTTKKQPAPGTSHDSSNHPKNISYSEIVNRLTDLKALAKLPAAGEKSAMWASYDRKSRIDSTSGAFMDWGANNDGFGPQYIRKEGENMVLAEMEGPGAIVRIWSANPSRGHVKIYIDGKETPVIDLPFKDLFNPSSLPAFNYPQLVYETAAKGFNNYVPITYQQSCKVIAEPEWGQYYQFNYISFPAGTTVGTFETSPSADKTQALARVNNFFEKSLGQLPYEVKGVEQKLIDQSLSPGDSKTITITGSKAIYSLKARLKISDEKRMDEALRKLILEVKWDDEKQASIWSPVGDFFGSAPGYNLYRTLPMGMTEEGMYSYWYMPFEKSATITLTNYFDEPVKVDLRAGMEEITNNTANYARFHAKWHRNLTPLSDPARWPDWTVLETTGSGRFLGMSLFVWNPKGGSCKQYGGEGHYWWGEGDEKFFVDDERFPSTFGTGTEDYFGYAWCIPNLFEHAFHSQNHTNNNMGYQSMNRWQVIDNVPFQRSFKAYLEKYFPDQWPTQYAVLPYWYLDAHGNDPIDPLPVNEIYGFETPYKIYREPGAIEGEQLQVVKNTGGYAGNDVFADERLFDRVSGHKVFIWFGKPGVSNELVLKFFVENAGRYKVTANLVKTPEGGNFLFGINQVMNQKSINLKSEPSPGSVERIELGVYHLTKGENHLKIHWQEMEGRGTQLMLDYIKLDPL